MGVTGGWENTGVLFPSQCPGCGALGPAPCLACRRALEPAGLLAPPSGVDACAAAFAFRGTGAELVRRLKYHNQRSFVPWAGLVLARLLPPLISATGCVIDPAHAVVTWAPTSDHRRRQRGYDQARLLARAMARSSDLAHRPQLRRSPGATQTGRDRAGRLVGPHFVARGAARPTVVVVDDVITTGATLAAAAEALRSVGATRVLALVLASTPLAGEAQVGAARGRNIGSRAPGTIRG